MLTVNYLRENTQEAIQGLTKKNVKNAAETVSQIIKLDDERKKIQLELDNFYAQANLVAKKVGELMKSGKKEEAELAKLESTSLKTLSKELAENLDLKSKEYTDLLVTLPNIPHISVPEGKTPEENIETSSWGSIPEMNTDCIPHWDLIEKYDIIDFELGNKITGAGFPVYKGKGARLQRALINFFLDEAVKSGYTEVQPPILVNSASGYGTGQLPDKEGMMYYATADDLYLIPTAEVPITNMYRDVIVKVDQLPIKNAGYTPCFRREAGSWGAHVRGLNRLHQFDKVEIVQIHHPENSYIALDLMCDHVASLLQKLELPYRILKLCGGDMSFSSALTFDFEVFSAAQKRWLEVSSVSNFETFQSNRLKLRFKDEEGKTKLLHTLNGSAMALPRIVAALLENNQTPDGIKIPAALVPYTGFDIIN